MLKWTNNRTADGIQKQSDCGKFTITPIISEGEPFRAWNQKSKKVWHVRQNGVLIMTTWDEKGDFDSPNFFSLRYAKARCESQIVSDFQNQYYQLNGHHFIPSEDTTDDLGTAIRRELKNSIT